MTTIVGLWDVELDPVAGVWLKQYPYGHGVRMSVAACRELAEALLAAADEADAAESAEKDS